MESVEEICDHVALINKAEKILDGRKTDIKQEYRNNTFFVDHDGMLVDSNGNFSVESSEETEQGYNRSLVKLKNGTTNDLLQELIGKTTIHSFVERIPSMNDIFITKVKSDNNE